MKNIDKLPYKVQFDPEYEQYNQRLGRLPVSNDPQFLVSDELIKLVDQVKEKLRDQDLEYYPSNIYSQYASMAELKAGKKNIPDNCPSCGDEVKKHVQCEFCAVMYCKNCCWRKRVLPNLSQPKQSKIECEVCHAKFVKLLANQRFYQESTVMQKIIDNSNTKLKKLEKDMKSKKERIEVTERKKKQCRIKEGILLKQLKNEEKKVQELQQKLQQVVKAKADLLRKQQEKLQHEKKLQEEQENERKRKQQQIQQALRRQKELQAQREIIKKKQEETERQLKQQMEKAEKERQSQLQAERLRKIEEEKRLQQQIKEQEARIKRKESEQRHKKETEELRNLAKDIIKEPQHLEEKDLVEGPPLVIMLSPPVTSLQSNTTPHKSQSPISSIGVNSSFQQDSSPLKVISSFNPPVETHIQQNAKKSVSSSNSKESTTKLNSNLLNQKQKTEATENTQKSMQNQEQLNETKSEKELEKPYKEDQNFQNLPPIAINVSQMTVNQLLGIHINPNAGNMNMNRRLSQRQSYLKEDRRNSEVKRYLEPQPAEAEPEIKQITEEEKYEILRSSKLSSSLIHSNNEEEMYEHPDPSGSKCNCNLM